GGPSVRSTCVRACCIDPPYSRRNAPAAHCGQNSHERGTGTPPGPPRSRPHRWGRDQAWEWQSLRYRSDRLVTYGASCCSLGVCRRSVPSSYPQVKYRCRCRDNRKIGFKSITENIDTTTSGGKLVFHIFGALAEF